MGHNKPPADALNELQTCGSRMACNKQGGIVMDKMGKVTMALGVAAAMVLGINAFAEEGQAGAKPEHKRGERMNPEEMFKKWDADSDGKVTKAEYLAASEARAKKAGKELTADQKASSEKRFTAMDGDSDGSLTLEEVKAAGEKMKAEHAKRAEGEKKQEKPQ